MPLFVSSKENRLLKVFFLYVLEDLRTSQGQDQVMVPALRPSPFRRCGPRRRGRVRRSGGGGAGAATPNRRGAGGVGRCRRGRPHLATSDWAGQSDVTNPGAGDPGRQSKKGCVGHTPCKTSRLLPAPHRLYLPSSPVQEGMLMIS
jgi:hypothetical protein